MADPELVKMLRQGSEVWNRWREQQPGDMYIDLSDADLNKANLRGVNLRGVNLYKANLSDTTLNKANLRGTALYKANLSDANLSDADLNGASLRGADLAHVNLNAAILDGADLSDAILNGADLRGASLRKTDLAHANLNAAILDGANLKEAKLTYARLSDAHLCKANLSSADLRHARLDGANLSDAKLTYARLDDTHLYKANLSSAGLHGAKLDGANLSDAKLDDADLSNAKLSGTTLQKAHIGNTIFASIDLREVRGLTELHYHGRSRVELHTVQLPHDGSAIYFLRGCGVPDEWIGFWRSTMMHPIQYHSCFISYTHQDNNLAHRLHSDLQGHGVRCWFAPHDMKIGDKIRPRIDEAIHLQDKLLLILSEHSVASDWVEHEVETALAKERKEKRTILFPIRLDNAILEREHIGWPALVQHERHIGDFTDWKDHDQYQVAFKRLLRDLKQADE